MHIRAHHPRTPSVLRRPMSRFFDNSPSKKPKPTTARAGSGSASSDRFQTVGDFFPDRVCPDEECHPPKHLLVRYKNGRPFVVCSKNVRDDPMSCQFTANKFDRDHGKGDSKIACIVCSVPVEHVLSIGRAVGKDPDSGKTSEFFFAYPSIFLAPVTSFVLTFRVCAIPCRCSRGK